jgi:hypothetical protein
MTVRHLGHKRPARELRPARHGRRPQPTHWFKLLALYLILALAFYHAG